MNLPDLFKRVVQKNESFINLLLFPQNPREADAMTKVQAELDETKIILVRKCRHISNLPVINYSKGLLHISKSVL